MKVEISSASDMLHEPEVKEVKSWNELIEFMQDEYGMWVINFNKTHTMPIRENDYEKKKVDLEVTKYDDYLE